MNKSILLVIGVASLLTVGLYSLPKVVVSSQDRKLVSDRTTTQAAMPDSAASLPDSASMHQQPLNAAQQKELERFKKNFATATVNQKAPAGAELIEAYRKISRFDSAARIAEELATLAPTEANLLKAGDHYYEAYGFAADAKKASALGQKTREVYQKALDKNPALLTAKANMAMTYVTTETPMQGIMLLREVLEQDPTNELALFNMGLLSMRSSQWSKAAERFRAILTTHPDNSKAQFYLAISLSELGKKDEARQLLAQVKQTEKDPAIQQAIRELEKEL
ncbi:tetratricopeptide repeat protein [Tellurirhabdus bombi]|jgi:tetratricopeptide (TPR) repeat protein|uniref:tetratricopeptide repeat protein n=1 Tax=Tellurirhabdus bombi TaxID=2907205 RepID=UPI001F3C0109|nr:tetratricopeptide repeat protein [Tellurirhabdus bombi]